LTCLPRRFSNTTGIQTVADIDPDMERDETELPARPPISEPSSKNQLQFWLLANACGLVAYLLWELWLLAPRPEAEALNGISAISSWLTINFPLLVSFSIANLIWLSLIIKSGRSKRQRKTLAIWLAVCFVWLAALWYDGIATRVFVVVIDMIVRTR
jgi:hypothetical protein